VNLEDGVWCEDRTMTDFLIDPLYGDEVSEGEASRIAAAFGGMPGAS
jgi:hypothetical protein